MRRALALVFVMLLAVPTAAFEYVGWQKGPWTKVDTDDGVTVYRNKSVPGDIHAYRADVVIDATPGRVMKAVLDHDRAASRSFVLEYDVLHDDGVSTRVYQQIQRTGLGKREFTTAGKIFRGGSDSGAQGFSFRLVDDGVDDPEVDSVARMEGSFVLTPVAKSKTRVSYRMYMDPGTWIPDFVLRRALRKGAVEVVELLRSDVEGG